jgi:transcription elongation GreA/GreB family factor
MKQKVHDTCCRQLSERIQSLKSQLSELIDGAKNDSKSTAGDKHETARAMMQIEQEKLTNQLNLLLTQEQVLNRIDSSAKHELVSNGALVKTDQGCIYISIPLGRIAVGESFVMCISAQSPLGAKLVGKQNGDAVEFNGTAYRIETIS